MNKNEVKELKWNLKKFRGLVLYFTNFLIGLFFKIKKKKKKKKLAHVYGSVKPGGTRSPRNYWDLLLLWKLVRLATTTKLLSLIVSQFMRVSFTKSREIINFFGRLRHLSIILLKDFYLFKIAKSVISFI